MLDMIEASDEIHEVNGDDVSSGGYVALIESRPFLRDCVGRSMQSALPVPVVTFSSLSQLRERGDAGSASLVVISLIEASREAWTTALEDLSEYASRRPVVTLASVNDVELARAAIGHGARGYIPVTMGFDIAVQAIRFVLAGGTYAPADCILASAQPSASSSKLPSPLGILTGREMAVVTAIKQGKINKVIAHELNMCESTVKVHVRNVMKKLNAKNRTEVAMRA